MRYSDEEKLAEIRQEIAYREAVYPGIISKNPKRADNLRKRFAIMRQIAQDYEDKIKSDKPQLDL